MIGVNLLPMTKQNALARRRRLSSWGGVVAVCAGVLVIAVLAQWHRMTKEAELERHDARLRVELVNLKTGLSKVQTDAESLSLQLNRAQALRGKRSWSSLLTRIANALPQGSWLLSVATDPVVPPLGDAVAVKKVVRVSVAGHKQPPPAIETPRKLHIVGLAGDVGEPHEFVTRLKETDMFSRVILKQTQREPALGRIYFRFELLCEW